MDRITKSYLSAFKTEQALAPDTSESDAFELFAAYCVVADLYDEEFDVADVHVGGSDDLGLDGIAIIVNGALIDSVEEVEDLLKVSGTLDVTFAFIQAKSSGKFNNEQIGVFFDGIDEFFSENPQLPMNESVSNAHAVMQKIYDNSVKFRRAKPICRAYYVTTGKWADDQYLLTKINKRRATLQETGLFSEVIFTPMGADEIQGSYQRSKNSVTAEFVFSNKVLLPDIAGVSEAYLGVLPVSEFIRLTADNSGTIRRSLFYENIRDFQDYNAVNLEIQQTLQNESSEGRFAVLNNGVTIVTRGLQTTGNKFVMSDFQIVNGCQTSHVLFNEKDHLSEHVFVPMKIIATEDEDIINAIVTATNRQTQVTQEDLYALAGLQKKLEAFFFAYPDKKRLFYERRSKQYNAVPGIEKVRIITKPQLIRAFAAMFMDDPHRASRYYADLRTHVGEKIFNEQHKLEPYYLSAYAHYKLEFLFRNGALPVYYKPARYHLLMAIRYIGAPAGGMPDLKANKIQPYCNSICEKLWNDASATEDFRLAIEAVDAALDGAQLGRDVVKTQTFTDAVKKALA
jgi:hypothetical protein